jgi:basic amino acid/polyamine antiporter, APA family
MTPRLQDQNGKIFIREATGIVKSISALDSVGIGIAAFALMGPYFFYFDFLASYPTANPLLATAIMGVLGAVGMSAWALLTITFPRSGGDYVFNTRCLHPTIGIMTDVLVVLTTPLSFPFFVIGSLLLFSDMFSLEAIATGDHSFSAASTFILTPNVEFALTIIMLLVTSFVLIGRIKSYVRAQTLLSLLGIAAILIVCAICFATSNSAYQSDFTHFFGVNYNSVITSAASAGLTTPVQWSAIPSLTGTSFLLFYVWLAWPSYVSGEMKTPTKSIFISMVGVEILGVLLFLIVGLTLSTFGVTFATSSTYLSILGKSPIPTEGFLVDLAAPLFANPIAILLIFGILSLANFFTASFSLMAASRKIFAWSFDRLLPSGFSDVSPRFQVPTYSSVLIAIIAGIYTVVFVYGPSIYDIAGGLGVMNSALFIGIGCLSAVVLPLRKSLFRQAPSIVQKRVGGIPVISLLGIFAFVMVMVFLIGGQILPALSGLNPTAAIVSLTMFLSGLPFYYIAKYVRNKQHIDIGLAYKEIPPE